MFFKDHDRCPACTCLLGPEHDFVVENLVAIDTDDGVHRVCRYCAKAWQRLKGKKKWQRWVKINNQWEEYHDARS